MLLCETEMDKVVDLYNVKTGGCDSIEVLPDCVCAVVLLFGVPPQHTCS